MISILMASYNYELYIGEAIKSVLNQTWIDFELLVIDDGSKDGSVALARSFAEHDPRVRVLQHPDGKNHGLPETLSLGIVEAGGDWIAFLESDDLWEPECLERRMELARQTRADVVLNAIRPLPMPGAGTGWFDIYVPHVCGNMNVEASDLAERTLCNPPYLWRTKSRPSPAPCSKRNACGRVRLRPPSPVGWTGGSGYRSPKPDCSLLSLPN